MLTEQTLRLNSGTRFVKPYAWLYAQNFTTRIVWLVLCNLPMANAFFKRFELLSVLINSKRGKNFILK